MGRYFIIKTHQYQSISLEFRMKNKLDNITDFLCQKSTRKYHQTAWIKNTPKDIVPSRGESFYLRTFLD